MDFDTSGINQTGIDKLVLDIYSYSDKIKSILNSIEDVIASTKDFYAGPDADEFRKKFLSEKDSINNLNSNILSYTEELLLVKKNFKNMSLNVSEAIFQEKNNFTGKAANFVRR